MGLLSRIARHSPTHRTPGSACGAPGTGVTPAADQPAGAPLKSRHILEGGNARAVVQITVDLEAISAGRLAVRLHPFGHGGRTLHNVEAELAGDLPELVLVTAHLDSTAASDSDFDSQTALMSPQSSGCRASHTSAFGTAARLETSRSLHNSLRSRTLPPLLGHRFDFEHNVLIVRPKHDWRLKTGDQLSVPMTALVRTLRERLARRARWVLTAQHSNKRPRGDGQISERRLLGR